MKRPSPKLLEHLAECEPGVANLALTLREMVLAEAPDAHELVYKVYAVVSVFTFTGKAGGAFIHIVSYARHVNLGFNQGVEFSPDPRKELEGTGKKIRHLRFDSPDDLRRGYVRHYIREAVEHARKPS